VKKETRVPALRLPLKIKYCNVRSIANSIDELIVLISQEPSTVFLLCETWLKEKNVINPLLCKTHNIIRYDRSTRGGGIIALIPKNQKFTELKEYNHNGHLESMGFNLIGKNGRRLSVVMVYRKPAGRCKGSLKKIFENLSKLQNHFILLGDFNLPEINWKDKILKEKCDDAELVLEFCNHNGFSQMVEKPTRGSNILDLCIVSDPKIVIDETIIVSEPLFGSDHNSITGTFDLNVHEPEAVHITIYDYSQNKVRLAHRDQRMRALVHDEYFENYSTQQLSDYLCDSLKYTQERYFSKSVTIGKKLKLPYTLGLLHNRKNQLWHSYKRLNDQLLKEMYFDMKKQFQDRLDDFVKKREISLFSNDSKQFWKCIRSRLKSRSTVPTLVLDSGLATSDIEKSQALLIQYDKVFTNDDGNGIPASAVTDNEIITCEFNGLTLLSLIKKLEGKGSFGSDGISSILMKKLGLPISSYLANLFNKSMRTTTIPKEWLLSIITPVPKKDNPSKPVDFRPVSMTCIACRLMEKVILSELAAHYERENLFSKNQHGFLKGRSTVTCLLECFSDWSECFEKKYSIDILYIDISKAFDSISHQKLLILLERNGVRGLLLKWIELWLTKRKQAVKVGTTLSEFKHVPSGVPQGSVLGPLLFCIYMSGLDSVLKYAKVKYYADDAKIYLKVSSIAEAQMFQQEVENILQWAKTWQLSVAFEKCAILHLNPSKSLQYEYTMGDIKLATKSQIRDLGVIIDDNLLFDRHIDIIATKAGQISNMIFQNFKCRDLRFLCMTYKAFIRPVLEYANETYFPKYMKDLAKLENVQRSFTRRIPALREMSFKERLVALKLSTLEERRIKSGLLLIYKYLNHLIKITDLPLIVKQQTVRARRGHDQMLHIQINKSVQRDQMICKLANIWNHLDVNLVNSQSAAEFKRTIERQDLSQYCTYNP